MGFEESLKHCPGKLALIAFFDLSMQYFLQSQKLEIQNCTAPLAPYLHV